MVHIQIQSLGFSKKEKYINADIISYLYKQIKNIETLALLGVVMAANLYYHISNIDNVSLCGAYMYNDEWD